MAEPAGPAPDWPGAPARALLRLVGWGSLGLGALPVWAAAGPLTAGAALLGALPAGRLIAAGLTWLTRRLGQPPLLGALPVFLLGIGATSLPPDAPLGGALLSLTGATLLFLSGPGGPGRGHRRARRVQPAAPAALVRA